MLIGGGLSIFFILFGIVCKAFAWLLVVAVDVIFGWMLYFFLLEFVSCRLFFLFKKFFDIWHFISFSWYRFVVEVLFSLEYVICGYINVLETSMGPFYKDYTFRGFLSYPFLECQRFVNLAVHFIRTRSSLLLKYLILKMIQMFKPFNLMSAMYKCWE